MDWFIRVAGAPIDFAFIILAVAFVGFLRDFIRSGAALTCIGLVTLWISIWEVASR
jgi:hypothetical protein